MMVHLLKDPVDPLAVQTITTQASTHQSPPVVVLLSPSEITAKMPRVTVYHVTEYSPDPKKGEIDYPRLVDLIFSADKVIAW